MYDRAPVDGRRSSTGSSRRSGDLVYTTGDRARTVRFPETTVAGEPITTGRPVRAVREAYRLLAREC